MLATQNPIEMEGTYPLPEAQLDRFMFNVIVDYLPEDEEVAVVQQTTWRRTEPIEPLIRRPGRASVSRGCAQGADRRGPRALCRATVVGSRPGPGAPEFVNQWVSWGAGLRAAQSLVLGAKTRALLRGRFHVEPEDIRALVASHLRHRILLGYRAEADGVAVDTVIDRLLEHVKGPHALMSILERQGAPDGILNAATRWRRRAAHRSSIRKP